MSTGASIEAVAVFDAMVVNIATNKRMKIRYCQGSKLFKNGFVSKKRPIARFSPEPEIPLLIANPPPVRHHEIY